MAGPRRDDAVSEVTVTTQIDRLVGAVFDYMADVTRFSEWQADTISAGWIGDGEVGVGSKAKAQVRVMGRASTAEFEVAHWDPPHAWGVKGSLGPVEWETLNQLESHHGGTRLVQVIKPAVRGWLRFMAPVIVRQHTKQVAADAQALKSMLEQGS